MALPRNGIFVVRGEMSTLMTAMKRGVRWNSSIYLEEEQDGIMKEFIDLKNILNKIDDLRLVDPNIYLGPFLNVIRTEETTGAVTSLALTAVNKFLSYGLIDPTHPTLAATVENIADAVTHARFMGTDQASDGVTLMRVVEVLHTLMRSPEGSALTNESVCEVMLSCFKICFEPRLNELLRRTAEQALKDMVLLLFMRLPQFSDDRDIANVLRKFKMTSDNIEQTSKKRKTSKILNEKKIINSINKSEKEMNNIDVKDNINTNQSPNLEPRGLKPPPLATTPATPAGNIVDMQGKITQTPTTALDNLIIKNDIEISNDCKLDKQIIEESIENDADIEDELIIDQKDKYFINIDDAEYVNSVGVRFTQQSSSIEKDGKIPLLPYGLPCIQELFRFLILLCNPLDKQNTDTMMHMGLSLLTVALEVAADNIGKYDVLLALVKDELCRNLFSLLQSERLTIFAADLQVCFLLFESLRSNLKFQLEYYLTKLSEIIANDNQRISYEVRELALDNLLQLWKIPGFISELYINYDCNLYCSDLFENLVKLLSKNTLTATSAIYGTHILSTDALLTVIESIERNCLAIKSGSITSSNIIRKSHSRNNSNVEKIQIESDITASGDDSSIVENITKFIDLNSNEKNNDISMNMISKEYIKDLKIKKRILAQGTELFNQRSDKGIQYLQENGILNINLDPIEIALFLRENPGLDKKMIGEYISKKKNVEKKILENFVQSFDFSNMRIDQALRLYLESFRLPGEAPLIFLVMEHFADHWHKCNNEPFANTDAAFRLAYAIIMLNMDQHNHNAKRLNVPMTPEDFLKNLRGLNGNNDFDQNMLLNVFHSIKNEEIVMPAEQTGIVRENYLWKMLLRRCIGKDGIYHYMNDPTYDEDIFHIVWGSTLSALSLMFDKSNENGYKKILTGFTKCACISAYYNLYEDFDALILTLCKFTTILNIPNDINEISLSISFGSNRKAQAALKTVLGLVHEYGNCLRDSWKNILDIIIHSFRMKLLPKSLIEVEDFCEINGKIMLRLEKPTQKVDSGLFSSLYSYLSSDGRQPTYDEQEIIKISKKCIRECQIEQIIYETKFIQFDSLSELIKSLLIMIQPPNSHKTIENCYSEDLIVFEMEFLVRIIIQNRDRMLSLWELCKEQFYLIIIGSATFGYDYLLNRTTIALLKLAIYLMRNEELCPIVLQSLKIFLMLKPNIIYRISKQISIGIYELLKTSAQNIHTEADWKIIFTLLECVGAGAIPPDFDDGGQIIMTGTKSDGAVSSEDDSGLPDRGYTSDTEIITSKNDINSTTTSSHISQNGENWILVNKDIDITSRPQSPINTTLAYPCKLIDHSPFALFKCWDSLSFIVRNVAHITPYNFEICVKCIRTFVEAILDGGFRIRKKFTLNKMNIRKKKKELNKNVKKINNENSSESEDEELYQRYETIAIQLLDLMYTLYTRTAQIFRWWAEEGCISPQCSALWAQGWCPLLQSIARLAIDRRREVRTYAISCLQQRALLVHDLQTLTGTEWANCFKQVLFPLLNELLPESSSIANIDKHLLEESRIRTATIMSKVFLHHLTPLIELSNFNDLWLEILDYIEKFMKLGSDMLYEQMLEILKNMLLVMYSVRVFYCQDGISYTPLWSLTWNRIDEFLPKLKDELFKQEEKITSQIQPILQNNQISKIGTNNLTQFKTDQNTVENNLVQNCLRGDCTTQKGSIILQPPGDISSSNPVIVGQVTVSSSPQHNIPIFIPNSQLILNQQTTNERSLDENLYSTNLNSDNSIPISSSLFSNVNNKLDDNQSINQMNLKTVSGIINNNEEDIKNLKMSTSEIFNTESSYSNVYQIKTNTEFSNVIELPETLTPPSENLQLNYTNIQPTSHQLAGYEYPGLKNPPTRNIVHSFSPVYSLSQPSKPDVDIFTDYVQNPYNLTLKNKNEIDDNSISNNSTMNIDNDNYNTKENDKTQTLGVSDIFQSANYFSGVDQTVIPPGSEILFGKR